MENLNKEIPPALKVVVEKIKTLPCNFVIIYAKGVRNLTQDELDVKNLVCPYVYQKWLAGVLSAYLRNLLVIIRMVMWYFLQIHTLMNTRVINNVIFVCLLDY